MSGLRIGSLCSGYGGLDMAVQAVLGGEIAWHAEVDPDASKVLAHHHPDVPNLGDIKLADWATAAGVDVVTGGYPCQPFSDAGLRLGVEDERHLWPWIVPAIRVLRPRLVVLENVRGHLRRGFDIVLADLAALGFDAEWRVVRASDVGAPHGRARLIVVATAQDTDRAACGERRVAAPRQAPGRGPRPDACGRGRAPAADAQGDGWDEGRPESAGIVRGSDAAVSGVPALADAQGARREGTRPEPTRCGFERGGCPGDVDWGIYEPAIRRWEVVLGRSAPRPTEPGRTGERLSPAFVEWMMGLPAGHVTAVLGLSRNAQLRLLGNGVVPQQGAAAIAHLLERRAAA